jgi:hypothetical protein
VSPFWEILFQDSWKPVILVMEIISYNLELSTHIFIAVLTCKHKLCRCILQEFFYTDTLKDMLGTFESGNRNAYGMYIDSLEVINQSIWWRYWWMNG